jgi:hypothetical protein
MALATGVIFGLIPALQSSRPDLVSELKERTGSEMFSGRVFSVRNMFIMVQVGLSLVALIGAGLFLMSLRNVQNMDPGFDTHNLGMITFDVGSLNYETSRVKEFQRRVLDVVTTTPGVRAATLSSSIPLVNGGFGRSIFPEGYDPSTHRNGMFAQVSNVSSDYLETMGIPMVQGHSFDSSVREDSPKAVVVNESAAKRFWPNADPIGKRFKFFGDDSWVQVIGVARDSKYNASLVAAVSEPGGDGILPHRPGDAVPARDLAHQGAGAGPQLAPDQCVAYWRGLFPGVMGPQVRRQPFGDFRFDRHAPLRSGNLRRGQLHRGTARSRDRRAPGPGRATTRRPGNGAAPERNHHGHRPRDRVSGRLRPCALHRQPALWCKRQ